MNNLSWKKIFKIFVIIIVPVIIALGIYYIITITNSFEALNSKIGEQQAIIADLEQATPEPTQNHDEQITELEISYNQKEALIENCREKADLIKSEYSKNEIFNNFCLKYNNNELTYYIDKYNGVMSDIERFSKEYGEKQTDGILAALKYSYYVKYSDENEQKIIQVEGLLNLLKTNFSDSKYKEVKAIISEINSPEI